MGSERTQPLVSCAWLAEHAGDPDIRVIEVDEDVSAFAKGHIPGAVRWDWNEDLRAAPRRDFIDQDGLTALLRAAGVDDGTTVVLYGGNNNWFAAYAYWLLRYRGFDAVRLLDGGRKRWELDSRPMSMETPTHAPGSVSIDARVRTDLRVYRDEVRDQVGRSSFVDVRSPEEFRGEVLAPPHLPQEQAQVPGHIPGAKNIPWSKAVAEDGAFRPPADLRTLYEGAGIMPDDEVIEYCRIGERSAHTWFVLHELLGYPNVRNYDGSWTEYGSLVGEPVETG